MSHALAPSLHRGGLILVVALLVTLPAGSVAGAQMSLPSADVTDGSAASDAPLDGTTNETTETTDNTTESTTETVENTTDSTTENTTDSTTENTTDSTTENTTDSTTETTENTTDSPTETTENTTTALLDGTDTTLVTETVDVSAALLTDTVNDLSGTATATLEESTETLTGTTETLTGTVDDTTSTLLTGTTTDSTIWTTLESSTTVRTALGVDDSTSQTATGDGPGPTSTAAGVEGPQGRWAALNERTGSPVGRLPAGAVPLAGVGVGVTIAAYGTRRLLAPASPWRYWAEARLGEARGRLDEARTGLAAGWEDLKRYLPGAVAYRYSRFDDSDPLAHERREAIHETAGDRPGIHLAALAERTGMPVSSLRHHVRVLEREGLLTTEKHGGRRRVYPVDVEQPALRAALSEAPTAGILEALRAAGPVRVGELARAVDLDPSTVSHHLGRLAEDGLVEREREGRAVTVRLAERVRAALRPRDTGVAIADD